MYDRISAYFVTRSIPGAGSLRAARAKSAILQRMAGSRTVRHVRPWYIPAFMSFVPFP
jgi:hypothetical protein